jgi:Leucine-rich repeat (LRR) protein
LGGENRFDNWKYGDACAPTHPSLDVASLLRLAGAGTSKRCTELRAALVSLCLEGKPYGELLDISSVRGVAGLRSLRVYGYELESRWEWRAESRPRQVMNLDTLSTLTGLQHLIIANTSGVDVAAIATLPHLRRLELSVTDVADLSPLASTKLESLFVAVSANLTSIDVLPRTLRRLHLEDLPLSSVAGLASLPALEDVYVGGVPLTELPKLASTKATVRFEPARTPRSEFDPVPEL